MQYYLINQQNGIILTEQKEVDVSFLHAFLRMKFKFLLSFPTKITFSIDKENKKGKIIMLESSTKKASILLSLIKEIEVFLLSKKIYAIEATLINKRLKKIAPRFGWAIKKKRLLWGDIYYKRLSNY